jgi:hypothetical protein
VPAGRTMVETLHLLARFYRKTMESASRSQ